MKSIIGRIVKLEEQNKQMVLQPVFVSTLDELDKSKLYSVIFCESDDVQKASEFSFQKLFYGGIYK